MRCLYCGKELALLKRWTGGGEFCSDAHRQRYQEEYNQLALNRLLQAKPPTKAEGPDAEAKSTKPSTVAGPSIEVTAPPELAVLKISEGARTKPVYHEEPSLVALREAASDRAPVLVSAPAAAPLYVEPVAEEPAPAELAAFLVEMPVVALADVAPMSHPDLEFLDAVAALPNRTFEPLNLQRDSYQLETAGLVAFEPFNRTSNHTASGTRERKVEVRDFVRTAPIVEIDLSPAGETGLETTSEAMDILIFPQPPQGLPVLWQEPPVGFVGGETELGALARLSFSATGFAGEDNATEADHASALAVAQPPAIEDIVQVVSADVASDIHVDIPEDSHVEVAAEPVPEVLPEPTAQAAPKPEPQPEPVVIEAAVIEAAEVQAAKPEVETQTEQIIAPEEPKMVLPELLTTPLPLTHHVSAPGKGKPAQVFASAANAVEVQVPRSTSLPLRAVMTFGPAPILVKNEVKPEPKKPASAPVRPDPRLANVKLRGVALEVKEDNKPTVKIAEPVKETAPALKQVAKTEISGAAKSPVKESKQDKKLEAKETVRLKEEAKQAAATPASLSAPYTGSSDLGLPRLNLQSSSGFLGQLPALAKVGIVVVLLAGIGGLIAYSSKSGGAATTSAAGTIVAGSALPAGEAGWITDWGSDPGVRRTRQISILRSSQTLTDYRIEMTGQIESKAIGWVFRAQDPKNFYVTKLEIVKPGLEPTVALVRFAIINGEEQAHAQLPLPMKVRLDTMYKIRFDALGNHFTTYVQDQKIDDWTDDHIRTGGVGFYRERGEDATLKGGMNVVPLIVRK